MRLIGHVTDKTEAERFAAFLLTKQISSHVELEGKQWEVWIRDEDQLQEADGYLKQFLEQPDAEQYRAAVDHAQILAREEDRKRQQAQKNLVKMQGQWNAPLHRRAPVTVSLIVISVIVAVLTQLGHDSGGFAFQALAATSLTAEQAKQLSGAGDPNLSSPRLRTGSLQRGEIWRAVTPIFLHFDPIHILFNMWILFYFGRQIEGRYGGAWFAFLVLAFAVPSTLSELVVSTELGGNPLQHVGTHLTILMGGMSGVNYGLFGYIWMKMTFDPRCGLMITPMTVVILLGWMLICVAGLVGNIANWAHGVGFVAGLIVGYYPKLREDLGWKREK